MSAALDRWAAEQRALADALGLSLDAWLATLDDAGGHRAGLTAAVIGASMATGGRMPNLKSVDGPALARRARRLISPARPGGSDPVRPVQSGFSTEAPTAGSGRPDHPVIAEAIRGAARMQEGPGAKRLARTLVSRPERAAPSNAPSSPASTADAPGEPQ